jgi:hypothetical protein
LKIFVYFKGGFGKAAYSPMALQLCRLPYSFREAIRNYYNRFREIGENSKPSSRRSINIYTLF